jgi:hypothetical protein
MAHIAVDTLIYLSAQVHYDLGAALDSLKGYVIVDVAAY